jgi:hypothetical protein
VGNQKKIPDFFIVGAPKSGTTALDYHLNLHSEIFMAKKELHYFGSDIGVIQDELSENSYLSYFDKATNTQITGESSVWYLYSEKAAKEIHDFNPNAKIIILLRKPTEMIPSLHGEYLYNGIEFEKDFEKALSNDIERMNTDTLLPCSYFNERPAYINSVAYYNQVKRYLNVFKKENILIILHENLKNDFNKTYKETLTFLGVSEIDFSPYVENINSRKNIQNLKIHQLSKSPPRGLKKIFRTLIPSKKIRHSIMKNVDDINIKAKGKVEISNEIKNRINDLIGNDVKKLEELIEKDLSSWLK